MILKLASNFVVELYKQSNKFQISSDLSCFLMSLLLKTLVS